MFFIGALLALAAATASCTNADMEAELAARRARLDELEKRDQQVRDVLYGKLNALRGKLIPIIEQVEADLKKKIDNESEKVEYALADSVARINSRIDVAFDKAQAYIDQNMGACYDDIYESFESLYRAKSAIHKQLGKAISEGDKNLEVLLREYETDISKLMDKAESMENRIRQVESYFDQAANIKKEIEPMLVKCKDLEEVYSNMEEQESKLLDQMRVLVSQEVLAKMEIDQINQMKGILQDAEAAIDEVEAYKSDMEGFLSDAEGFFDQMEGIASYLQDDIIPNAKDIVEQGESLRQMAQEYESYFLDFDPAAMLDDIESTKYDMEEVVESIIDIGEDAIEEMNAMIPDVQALSNDMDSYWDNAEYMLERTAYYHAEVADIIEDHPWIKDYL